MPSRNVLKIDTDDTYYHIYARGRSKQAIFKNTEDYKFFISLFARYLSKDPHESKLGLYPHLHGKIELLSYCLMNNHFHMLVYQIENGSMKKLMQSIMTSYSRYFNTKYGQSGALFESRYKASLIDNQSYLVHISRYIHLNPRYYKFYAYSSYRNYLKTSASNEWLELDRIKSQFDDTAEYKKFTEDYDGYKNSLTDINIYLK